jgi:hypothetical protein
MELKATVIAISTASIAAKRIIGNLCVGPIEEGYGRTDCQNKGESGRGRYPPFAMMERISAEMDRQVAAMFAQADSLAAQACSGSPQPAEAAVRSLPASSASYSFISTMSGNGVCAQSVEITSPGNGGAPRVVSHSFGNCGPQAVSSGPVNLPVARPRVNHRPDPLLTKSDRPQPYAGIVRQVSAAPR